MKKIITNSEKQTIELGKKIAKDFQGGEVINLSGNLGAGKTTLVKGIAQGLGIKQHITSPTFVLMKVYKIKNLKIKNFIHIDCYRLESPEDILDIGADEYFNKEDSVVLIEWPEKIKAVLPRQIKKIKLSLDKKDNQREINLNL